jgi:hypothetical protein
MARDRNCFGSGVQSQRETVVSPLRAKNRWSMLAPNARARSSMNRFQEATIALLVSFHLPRMVDLIATPHDSRDGVNFSLLNLLFDLLSRSLVGLERNDRRIDVAFHKPSHLLGDQSAVDRFH